MVQTDGQRWTDGQRRWVGGQRTLVSAWPPADRVRDGWVIEYQGGCIDRCQFSFKIMVIALGCWEKVY